MQEKRIKSLKLTDPLTIWSRGRRGRDSRNIWEQTVQSCSPEAQGWAGSQPRLWAPLGSQWRGQTRDAHPNGLPQRSSPSGLLHTGLWDNGPVKEEAGHRELGWPAPQGTRERGEPSLCTDSSSGHQGGQGPDAQLRVPMSSPSYPSKLSSQSPTALNHVLPHGATPASLHPTFLLAGPLTFPHTPTSCLPNTSPSSKALPKHQLPPTVFPGHYLHQPSP